MAQLIYWSYDKPRWLEEYGQESNPKHLFCDS